MKLKKNIMNYLTNVGLAFSENSELLGVAQSDNMVFVYRVGADWSGKKVICNKFPLTGTPLRLLSGENGFYTGTSDGKIRYKGKHFLSPLGSTKHFRIYVSLTLFYNFNIFQVLYISIEK